MLNRNAEAPASARALAIALLVGVVMSVTGVVAQEGGEPTAPAPEAADDGDKQPVDESEADTKASPIISHDLEKLPFPARRMHELLVEAAVSGDIEKLRPYIGEGDDQTMLSFGGVDGDPIDYLQSVSGDEDGYEILAILQEILQAGYVHLEPGSENEMFVWPYFFGVPLEELDAAQRVELYRLVTHGDYLDMKSFGAYIFYRVGITPQGRWRFFVAGD